MSENGHANGLATRGAMGGLPLAPTGTPRSALAYLTRTLNAGAELTESELAANIKFAVGVRDDPSASRRDKLRAVAHLDALMARGVDIAMYLDKCDRLDGGGVTERVGFVKYVGGVSEADL